MYIIDPKLGNYTSSPSLITAATWPRTPRSQVTSRQERHNVVPKIWASYIYLCEPCFTRMCRSLKTPRFLFTQARRRARGTLQPRSKWGRRDRRSWCDFSFQRSERETHLYLRRFTRNHLGSSLVNVPVKKDVTVKTCPVCLVSFGTFHVMCVWIIPPRLVI